VPQEFSAGAVIFYQRRGINQVEYLLLHYDAGHWDLPKGHIEPGETLHKTVRREVREETGIKKIRILPGFKMSTRYFFRDHRRGEKGRKEKKQKTAWIFKMVTFFAAQTYTKSVKLSREHNDYQWLPYRQALKRLTYPKAKKLLRSANSFLESRI